MTIVLNHIFQRKGLYPYFAGVMLMMGYLGFDGFTSTFQDKLFKGYMMETYNQVRLPAAKSCKWKRTLQCFHFRVARANLLYPQVARVTNSEED